MNFGQFFVWLASKQKEHSHLYTNIVCGITFWNIVPDKHLLLLSGSLNKGYALLCG